MQAKLTAEIFNDIVANLKSDRSLSRGDKRTQGRVGLRCALDVIPCTSFSAQNKPVTVWVRDISVQGIGLMTSKIMEHGLEFIARFVRDGQTPLCILYRVRYRRRLSNDLHCIGASFERVMADATGAVAMIGKPKKAKPASPSEKADLAAAGAQGLAAR